MALTDGERLSVFEIMDFPPNANVVVMWGLLGSDEAVQQYSFRSPSEAIDTLIGQLTSAMEVKVRQIIATHDPIVTSERRVDEAEDVRGVVEDHAERRKLNRRRLQVYIPVYLQGELEMRHAEQQMGGNRIMRG